MLPCIHGIIYFSQYFPSLFLSPRCLDFLQSLSRDRVELLVIHQQAEVAVEEGENVIHPVGQPANELVLKVGGENLHIGWANFAKAGGVRGAQKI